MLKLAINDYIYLLNKDYPEKSVTRLVSDHYKLNKIERIILHRGVCSDYKAGKRKNKIQNDITKCSLFIDGLNVLITLSNYLLGRTVFIGNDGFMRDAGEAYDKSKYKQVWERTLNEFNDYIYESKAESIVLYIDNQMATDIGILEITKQFFINSPVSLMLSEHVDDVLSSIDKGVVVTADSGIIDRCKCKLYDLAQAMIKSKFNGDIIDLSRL